MRALVQRVAEARVDIAGETVGEVGNGMLILVCAMQGDGDDEARFLARKIANLRIFESEPGKMNLSVLASGGGALIVSQFTLAADTSRGNRPGFSRAAPPDEGERLYELFTASLAEHGVPIATGRFGQVMQVHLVNDGPSRSGWIPLVSVAFLRFVCRQIGARSLQPNHPPTPSCPDLFRASSSARHVGRRAAAWMAGTSPAMT